MPSPAVSGLRHPPQPGRLGQLPWGAADRGREQQDSELGSCWLGQLEASLLGSVGLTGWSWKNDKCLLRASSEWPDHKPQDWTRAALLCLGLGPELSAASVRLGAEPQRSRRRLTGQPALGKEYLGPGRALLAKKDSRPVRRPVGAHLWHLTSRQAASGSRENSRAEDNGVHIPALLPAGAETPGPLLNI